MSQQGVLIILCMAILLHVHCFFQDSMLQEIGTFMIIEGNLKFKDRWKLQDPEKLKIFIVTLLLIGVYKSKWEPVHMWSKNYIKPTSMQFLHEICFKKHYAWWDSITLVIGGKTGHQINCNQEKKYSTCETVLCKMPLSQV